MFYYDAATKLGGTYSFALVPMYVHLSVTLSTVELQLLKHLWNHENMFETGVVRANECYS